MKKKLSLFAGAGRSCWNIIRKQIILIPTITLICYYGNDDDTNYTLNITWLLWGVYVGMKVQEV